MTQRNAQQRSTTAPKPNTIDVLYRVSRMGKRDKDDEATRTLAQQRRAVERVLKANGWRIGKTYELLDESGFTVLGKIGDDVVQRVADGKTRGLVVGFSNRLTRNWWEGGGFLLNMSNVDADLIDADDPALDYRTDSGRTQWGIKMVINEMPSLDAKRKSNELADELTKLGIPSRVPYGYRRNGQIKDGGVIVKTVATRPEKWIVPDERTSKVVKRIYRERDKGWSWERIAAGLNRDGIPAPRGGHWVTSSLKGIIDREAYLGIMVNGTRRNEQAWTPLVTLVVWRRVQATETISSSGRMKAGIAGGVLVCETCKQSLSVMGNVKLVYGCRRRSSSGKCARPVHVSKRVADAFVEALVVELLDSSDGVDVVASARELRAARQAWDAAIDERKRFAKQITRLRQDDFDEGYAELLAAEQAAEAHYRTLHGHKQETDELPTGSAWRALDLEHRRDVVRKLLQRIVVAPPAKLGGHPTDAEIEQRFHVEIVGTGKMRGLSWEQLAA